MKPPTPKYKIGDSVWAVEDPGICSHAGVYAAVNYKVVEVHQYAYYVNYGVVATGENRFTTDDLSFLEEDMFSKREAEEKVKLCNKELQKQKKASETARLKKQLEELKKLSPENIKKQIKALEEQLKKLKGEQK